MIGPGIDTDVDTALKARLSAPGTEPWPSGGYGILKASPIYCLCGRIVSVDSESFVLETSSGPVGMFCEIQADAGTLAFAEAFADTGTLVDVHCHEVDRRPGFWCMLLGCAKSSFADGGSIIREWFEVLGAMYREELHKIGV